MKISFYIPNEKFQNVDCRKVEYGNPGIGGTWHMFLIVSSQLARRDNGIGVTVFVQVKNDNLPAGPDYQLANDPIEAIRLSDNASFDYIIINSCMVNWDEVAQIPFKSKIQLIPWCHNFINKQSEYLNVFAESDRIARVINVSREQMDLYMDHPAYDKMDYIFNCVPYPDEISDKITSMPFACRDNIVTYVGSLVPAKCFHVLATIWSDIVKRVPNAQLYIIGSGKLYDENAKLGKYNIAEETYEKKFMTYLTDSKGCILPNVHFMGNMGIEKNDILLKTKVGVPNPTGLTETFCISAVEMQQMGCAVTAMYAPGYLDTFVNGKLVNNKKALSNSIVELLKSTKPHVPYDEVMSITEKFFSVDNVVSDWESLFETKCRTWIHPVEPLRNNRYHLKSVKYFLRNKNKKLNLLKWIKNIEYYIWQYERIRRHIRNY